MTTITDIINNDFKTVFPSIIGGLNSQLTVDQVFEFTFTQLENDLNKIEGEVNKEELEEILLIKKLLDVVMDCEDYDVEIIIALKDLCDKYPNPSFRFLLYLYQLSTLFDTNIFSFSILEDLCLSILSDDILFNLSDFLQSSNLGYAILRLTETSDELIKIFEKGINKYPNKLILYWIVAHLHRLKKDYQESLNYCLIYLHQISSDNQELDFDFTDDLSESLILLEIASLYYAIGDYTSSIDYCNQVIELEELISDKEEYSNYYYDALLQRMQINVVKLELAEFSKDYHEITKVSTEEELRYTYPDIIDFAIQFNLTLKS